MTYKVTKAVQYFEDDVRGPVPYRDINASSWSDRARVRDIMLLVKVSPEERRLLKKAIVDDINQRGQTDDNTRRL